MWDAEVMQFQPVWDETDAECSEIMWLWVCICAVVVQGSVEE